MCKVYHEYGFAGFFSQTVMLSTFLQGMFLPRAMYWGTNGARANYRLQISNLVQAAHASLEESFPVVIGECGIPMDMKFVSRQICIIQS